MAVVQEQKRVPERRRRTWNPSGNPLIWCQWVGYLFFLMAMSFVHVAKPKEENVFHHAMNIKLPQIWDRDLLTLSWFFLWLTLLVGIGGLLFNAMRLRRKKDHLSYMLILLLVITVGAVFLVPEGNSFNTFMQHYRGQF